MRVFIYPENEWGELGAKRWQLSWEQLKKSAESKSGKEEIDFDSDIDYMIGAYSTEEKARAAAKKILDSGVSYFCAVSLVQQVVDWFEEGDRVAEWRDIGRAEEIS